jgi:hypothetical protein
VDTTTLSVRQTAAAGSRTGPVDTRLDTYQRPDTAASAKSRHWGLRHFWVLVHRYAGLYMAFFLTVAGVTGSLLAFYSEIETWLNAPLHKVEPSDPPLDLYRLIERAQQLAPQGQLTSVPLTRESDEAFKPFFQPRIDPAMGEPFALEFDQLFLNPYTGERLGSRTWGEVSLARVHLMPFVYRLHYELALPNGIGLWLFGIAAIIWTLDCFVGLYLTFPRGRPFWKKWTPAWKVKTSGGPYRVNFDLHRAGGFRCPERRTQGGEPPDWPVHGQYPHHLAGATTHGEGLRFADADLRVRDGTGRGDALGDRHRHLAAEAPVIEASRGSFESAIAGGRFKPVIAKIDRHKAAAMDGSTTLGGERNE